MEISRWSEAKFRNIYLLAWCEFVEQQIGNSAGDDDSLADHCGELWRRRLVLLLIKEGRRTMSDLKVTKVMGSSFGVNPGNVIKVVMEDLCWRFVCSSASAWNCQCSTSLGIFSRYRTYIFPREEGSLSCLRLTQGVTPMSTTSLYRCYINWG
jgi:hypothetical protein